MHTHMHIHMHMHMHMHVCARLPDDRHQSGVKLKAADAGKASSDYRTSSQWSFPLWEEAILPLDQRVQQLTRIPLTHAEQIQVRRRADVASTRDLSLSLSLSIYLLYLSIYSSRCCATCRASTTRRTTTSSTRESTAASGGSRATRTTA